MQHESGIYKWLSTGWMYNFFTYLVGTHRSKQWLAEHIWKCKGGEKVVDMGCGTGKVLDFLPEDVTYIGYDISEEYINVAQERYGERAQFLVGTAREFLDSGAGPLQGADLVMCTGLLHHLDDEVALDTLRLARKIMAPTGRLVSIDPTYLMHQTWLSKWIISKDRGRSIRSEQQWKELIKQEFTSFSTSIVTGLIRVPYVHIVMEGRLEQG